MTGPGRGAGVFRLLAGRGGQDTAEFLGTFVLITSRPRRWRWRSWACRLGAARASRSAAEWLIIEEREVPEPEVGRTVAEQAGTRPYAGRSCRARARCSRR